MSAHYRVIGFFCFTALLLGYFPGKAAAAVSACTVTISPTSVTTITSSVFSIRIDNPSSQTIVWIQATRPSSNFTITNVSSTGWNSNISGSLVTLTGGSLTPATGFMAFYVTALSGSSEASSANWTVQVSDDGGGASPTTCTGTTGTAISGVGTDTTAPTISNIVVSDVTETTVKITWTTDESGSSSVDYGTTNEYGSTKSDSTSVTSHSVSLDSLSANTTYHYNVKSTDSASNTGESGDNTFVTAKSGSTGTSTTGTTKTITLTPTPAPDRTKPVITLTTQPDRPLKNAPTIAGAAIDDRGIVSIDYSINDGKSWLTVKRIAESGQTSVSFSFIPAVSGTGIHAILVRARDTAGNIGISSPFSVTLDESPPQVLLQTDITKSFPASPELAGQAIDGSGESSIEYSLDNGTNWLPVDEVSFALPVTSYRIILPRQEDGNYPIKIRATDALGNSGEVSVGVLVIDRLPPRIGGGLLSLGPFIMTPTPTGVYTVPIGTDQKLTLSAVGGPTSMVLAVTPTGGFGSPQQLPLTKRPTGLWSTTIRFDEPGTYSLSIDAVDGANNRATRAIGSVVTVPSNAIVDSDSVAVTRARVKLFVFDPDLQEFVAWQGAPYGQFNPQTSDDRGWYQYFVPQGRYYMTVEAPGFRPLTTSIINVSQESILTVPIALTRKITFSLGPWKFSFDFRTSFARIALPVTANKEESLLTHPLVGLAVPDFSLGSDDQTISSENLRGSKVTLSILNTWSPQAASTLAALDRQRKETGASVFVLVPHESVSSVRGYQKRGGYSVPMVADPDGTIVDSFGYVATPMHITIDKDGTVRRVNFGLVENVAINNN